MKATYIEHGGSDLTIVNAARTSFSQGSDWEYRDADASLSITGYEQWLKDQADQGFLLAPDTDDPIVRGLKKKDQNLIEYLARGMPRKEWETLIEDMFQGNISIEPTVTELMKMAQHWVPFTHNWIHLHVTAPVPIARQMFKAKIGFTESEESRRYVSDTPTLYIPTEFRAKADNVKQGSGGKHERSESWLEDYKIICYDAITLYDEMIADGVAPEQARFILPQGVEVQWRWSGNVASFARMFNQRVDNHAQLESQILAKEIGAIIEPLFPVSWKALTGSKRTDVDV